MLRAREGCRHSRAGCVELIHRLFLLVSQMVEEYRGQACQVSVFRTIGQLRLLGIRLL
jgi:hypothetical protein